MPPIPNAAVSVEASETANACTGTGWLGIENPKSNGKTEFEY